MSPWTLLLIAKADNSLGRTLDIWQRQDSQLVVWSVAVRSRADHDLCAAEGQHDC